jgi:hypothetical protein
MKYQHDSSDEKEPKNSRDTNVLVLIILLAQSGSNPPLPLRRAPAKIWALGSCLGDILALCCTGQKNGSLRCPETETTLREAWRRRWRLFSCTLPVCYTVYLAFLYIQVEKLESRQACLECLASGGCLLTCFDRCKDCGSSGNRPADCAPYGLTTDCSLGQWNTAQIPSLLPGTNLNFTLCPRKIIRMAVALLSLVFPFLTQQSISLAAMCDDAKARQRHVELLFWRSRIKQGA